MASPHPTFGNLEFRFQCDQPLADMTPTKRGHHCARCDKAVHDLRNLNDAEITDLMRAHPNGFCGSVYQWQLTPPEKPRKRTRLDWMLAAAASFLLLISSPATGQSQAGHSALPPTVMVDQRGDTICPQPASNATESATTPAQAPAEPIFERKKSLYRIEVNRSFPFIHRKPRFITRAGFFYVYSPDE